VLRRIVAGLAGLAVLWATRIGTRRRLIIENKAKQSLRARDVYGGFTPVKPQTKICISNTRGACIWVAN
jgi:hypothetical protein